MHMNKNTYIVPCAKVTFFSDEISVIATSNSVSMQSFSGTDVKSLGTETNTGEVWDDAN